MILKKPNLRAKIQDGFSDLSFHIHLTTHEAEEFIEMWFKSNNCQLLVFLLFI